jgi:putative sigma-54 modulation protein
LPEIMLQSAYMKIIIRGTNIDLTPSIKAFVEEKVGSIGKFVSPSDSGLAEARVEVGKPSQHHKTGVIFYAEINLKIGGQLFRGVAEHADLYTAIDFARNEVEEQIKKEKRKVRDSHRVPKRV